MTPETKAELLKFGELYFAIPKSNWTPEDLKAVYDMYNKIHGTDKIDQGCGSCRRDTITDVKNHWFNATKETQAGTRF